MTQDVQQLPDVQSGLTRRCTQAAAATQHQQQLQRQPSAEAAGCSSESGRSADLDVVLLDEHDSSSSDAKLKRQLLMSGVITALGIALHNFPEGVAVFLAAQKSPAIGKGGRRQRFYRCRTGSLVCLLGRRVHVS
jgi:zinc transporter ZupT